MLREGDHWVVRYVHGFPQDVIGARMDDQQEPHAVLAIETRKPVVSDDAFADQLASILSRAIRNVRLFTFSNGPQQGLAYWNWRVTPLVDDAEIGRASCREVSIDV